MPHLWAGVVFAGMACCAANAAGLEEAAPGEQCRVAIEAAEQAQSLPPRLLAAIGRVESGRRDPQTGRWLVWPWTIDVAGQGEFFSSKQDAVAAVQTLLAQGVRSIDVGCVQINLAYHPSAFRSVEEALDPRANASYGARFLRQLFDATGDWTKAAALYHSATSTLAAAYQKKVLAVWTGASITPQPPDPREELARAWAATLDRDETSTEAASMFLTALPPATERSTQYSGELRHGKRGAGRAHGRRLAAR
jgi:hypothetical protein